MDYGATAGEALATRPQHEGRSTVNTELALRTRCMLSSQSAVAFDTGVTKLGSGISDSPLVDRSTTARVSVGYLYLI